MSQRRTPPPVHWPHGQRAEPRPELRAKPGAVQPKTVDAGRTRPPMTAPPVVWPHTGREASPSGSLQAKAAGHPAAQARTLQAPAVHWPHSAPKSLQAKAVAHPTLPAQRCAEPRPGPLRWPAIHPAVIQRALETISPEYEAHYECTSGHVVSFKETDNEHIGDSCPFRCDGTLYNLSSDESKVYYCTNESCTQFHLVTKISGKCLQCDKAKAQLSQKPAYVAVEPEERSHNKAERRLIALLQKAQSFVEGSGTHHRSKGGKHTSSATEMHSSAHKGKKMVRDSYASDIQDLLDSGQVNDSKLIKQAKEMIGKVENK